MHMTDALISPTVGISMWAVSAGFIAYCSKKIQEEGDDRKIPLMGVLGAFVFAAQMINFTIPATGSSGHLSGGMILAILLGPYSAFLVMASVLIVQALFFGDGGLFALGCNIFNLGFYSSFIGYLLIYRNIVKKSSSQWRILTGSMIASIAALLLGAFSVVLETFFSEISELPFHTFVLLMLPIHLAIGIVEGMTTAAIILFIRNVKPEILVAVSHSKPMRKIKIKKMIVGLLCSTFVTAGALSWFASTNPDGLEWAIFLTSGEQEIQSRSAFHRVSAFVQEKTAFLPDYGSKNQEVVTEKEPKIKPSWPKIDFEKTTAGLVGATLTLLSIVSIGFILKGFYTKHGRHFDEPR